MWILLGTVITTSFFDSLNPSAIAEQMLLQAMVKNKRHTLEYVLPTEYITSREVGVLKKRVVYDSSIGFPEELADDIMECLLHKCA